jgi:hypothetical protein
MNIILSIHTIFFLLVDFNKIDDNLENGYEDGIMVMMKIMSTIM